LSQWLHAGLTKAGLEVVLLETRQVNAALSAMVVKTDRKNARGIAQVLRMGWFRPVHCKSPPAQEVRALLVGRKLMQAKLLDVELSIRGILRSFGLKVGAVSSVEAGASRRATAAKFEFSLSCVVKLVQRWRRTGTLAPDPVGVGRRARLADHAARATRCWRPRPTARSPSCRPGWRPRTSPVSPAAISRFLKACGLTRKKGPRTPPSRTAPTSPPQGALGARSSRR
jgi:transposase